MIAILRSPVAEKPSEVYHMVAAVAEFLALNNPSIVVMDLQASQNLKRFQQEYEMYVVVTYEPQKSPSCSSVLKSEGRESS